MINKGILKAFVLSRSKDRIAVRHPIEIYAEALKH
jgi:hypothetical protein